MLPDKQKDLRSAPCPRCGRQADFRLLGPARKRVEIFCPDCGRLEVPRFKFEQVFADIAEPKDSA